MWPQTRVSDGATVLQELARELLSPPGPPPPLPPGPPATTMTIAVNNSAANCCGKAGACCLDVDNWDKVSAHAICGCF